MSDEQQFCDLKIQIAALEERMNTHQSDYRTDIEKLARKMAERDVELARRDARMADRDVELARRDARMADRDARNVRWMVGLVFGMMVVTIGSMGVMFRIFTGG